MKLVNSMGVQIKDILEYDEVDISILGNKKLAVDSFNMIYQFLASIRQPDGTPLTDSKGNTTSHLKGLFNRCVYFKKNNIKAVFVFDGEAPKLKEKERENRRLKKIEADKKYKEALELGLMDEAKKYAQGINKLDEEMIQDSKKLVELFGFPVVEAPSEGEAQAAYFVDKGQVFASASQDFDSLLFGAKYLVRNVSVSSRRKVAGSSTYREVPIEFYDLNKILTKLNISHDELIIIAILCGTDFNPGGIKGIGPKTAQRLIVDLKDKLSKENIEINNSLDLGNTVKNEALTALVNLGFNKNQAEKQITKILQNNSEFSVEEVIKIALKGL